MTMIRERALQLLEHDNLTATAIAGKLGVKRNSASHAIARAHAAGEVRIVDYLRTGKDLAPVYGLGGGDDVERPAPLDPYDRSAAYRARHPDRNRASSRAWRERNLEHVLAKQAEYRARRRTDATPESVEPVESCSQSPALSAKEISVSESVLQYFELDVLPGVKHFTCDRYKATLSVESCADKFKQANSGDAFGRHAHCKRCPIGAAHGGSGPNLNLGTIKGSLTCSRCHRTNGRLIGKRLCTSCQNRQYESIKKRNAKGSAPIKLPPLHRLTIGYMAGGKVHMHTVERAVDTTELIVDVLRDSERSPSFGWLADSATRALRNNPDLDFSISSDDVDEVVPAAIAASVPASLDVVQADPAADVDADPYDVLRDAVEQLEHDAPVLMPTMSRRAGKKLRQQARKQVRVSNVTVNLLRGVGVLPAATPVVEPAPQPFFSPTLMSGGTAFG